MFLPLAVTYETSFSPKQMPLVSVSAQIHTSQRTKRSPARVCCNSARIPRSHRTPSCSGTHWSYRVAKRMLDLVLAIALLPFFVPICLLLMLLIKCGSKGPVFYRQLRVGQDSRGFHLYKFRTMFLNSDVILKDYLATDPIARQEWEERYKLRRDPRVTPLGAILRRTSLDELPQIINVLLGHMSFVGPRPIVRDEVARYGRAFAFYAAAKPGITGLWQVSGRGTFPYETRVSLDIRYVTTWTFLDDLRVLLKTARVVCSSEGAY